MKTDLDNLRYTEWFTESAIADFNAFSLIVRTGDSLPLQRFKITFDRSVFTCTFNEFARNLDDEDRGGQIIHEHLESALMKWVEVYTLIFTTETKREQAKHFSILLSDNIYHIISCDPPTIQAEPAGSANLATLGG